MSKIVEGKPLLKSRFEVIKKIQINIFALFIVALLSINVNAQDNDQVYFTNGFKLGEVTDSSVVVWTRLCKAPSPLPITHKRKDPPFRSPINFNNDMPANEMDGAVEGKFGFVKITIKSDDTLFSSAWLPVSSYKDYTLKKQITGLKANQRYQIILNGRINEDADIAEIKGKFSTAPKNDQVSPITFTSTSCQYFWDYDDSLRGFKVYDSMLKLDPLFHCQTGDFVYYDKGGPMSYNVDLARHKWHAINSWSSLVEFFANTPIYLQKDDHDVLKDDASPGIAPFGELSFQDGIDIWYEQSPIIDKPYRTLRWGKNLQIWLVEGREFRSDNWEPDGSNKTIWGKEQKEWFAATVKESDATFKILVSPTPVVGPDRAEGKNDNHANGAFKTEGDWLRKFLADNDMFVINGDRHWQYVSVDDETGIMEFSQGASSDSHAQGWGEKDKRPEHKFLRVKGGFLAVQVYQTNKPTIKFMHCDVDGNIVNEEIITKQ